MNEDFQVVGLPDGNWAVNWTEWRPVCDRITAIRLFELVEKVNTGYRMGFSVNHHFDNSSSIYWVESMMLFRQDSYEQLAAYLVGAFDITGVIFTEEKDARALKFELDKLLTWYHLKTSYDNVQAPVA